MSAIKTAITEIVTGLAMLGGDSVESTLSAGVPQQLRNVDQEMWEKLVDALDQRTHPVDFLAAWNNGRAFLNADDGLRRRPPLLVEWKGPHRDPADGAVPADLRVDHVYLISCKYLSQVLHNASPLALFDRCLKGAQGSRSDEDWFDVVAPAEHQELYQIVRRLCPTDSGMPESVAKLTKPQRQELRLLIPNALGGKDDWGGAPAQAAYSRMVEVTSEESAKHWNKMLPSKRDRSAMLWKLLRLAPAPYFVLGTGRTGPVRLRVGTPWDFNQAYKVRRFEVSAQSGGQARVGWSAEVEERETGQLIAVLGHVEVRWSHGRFGGPPEAKVYLDTPHESVPGYWPLN